MRWVMVGLICAVQGASGWYFTVLDVHGLDDFDLGLSISMVAFPTTLLLIVLDFTTTRHRAVLWTWLVLRAVAVPMLGLGAGSLVRVWFVTEGSDRAAELIDSHAASYAWQVALLGAALLAIQPLLAVARRIAIAVLGAPRATTRGDGRSVVEAVEAQRSIPEPTPKWPGSPRAKGVAGTLAFALLAATMLTLAGRVYWHVAVDTSASAPDMVASGTVDGREIAVVGYSERAFLRLDSHERVAAYDLGSGELMWDRRLPNEREISATVDAVLIDERGAFLRMDDHAYSATWFALDPRTGKIETTADEGNLQTIDVMDDTVPGIPGDVVERYLARDDQGLDEGYDYKLTDDADIERVFRYDDESLLINPVTGRPAGEDHGFTLHRRCCSHAIVEAHSIDGDVLWSRAGNVPEARDVVAETPGGRVIIVTSGPESKWLLITAGKDGFTETVVGDRGWFPW